MTALTDGMPTRIKVCGITRLEDAQLAIELGSWALGFNFYPPSPRYIAPAAARAIIRRLPPLAMSVGVFADETDAAHILVLARQVGVGAVQLHGPRFPSLTEVAEAYPLIVAAAVREGFKLEDLHHLPGTALLLDTFDPNLRGGTGRTFDWSMAREAKQHGPIILAGGLTPENVAQAIREVRPFAVDVASGVESAPGIKDVVKVRAFFAAVAEADREL